MKIAFAKMTASKPAQILNPTGPPGSGKVSDRIVSGHNIPRFCNWSITVLQHTCSDYSITNIINIIIY